MEAIIRDGSRQLVVKEGDTVFLDYREAEPGSVVELAEVLMVKEGEPSTDSASRQTKLGTPLVSGAKVVGTVLGHVKGPKLIVMSFRRRKNSKSRVGHRQRYTEVKIDRIEA